MLDSNTRLSGHLNKLLAGSPFEKYTACLEKHFSQVDVTPETVANLPGIFRRNICGCDIHQLTAYLVEKVKQPLPDEPPVVVEEAPDEVQPGASQLPVFEGRRSKK
ncbi:MAG: hypothetical protein KJ077_10495 [Anaerolineae bacterium]|nr:hypothetical protein [Anaerolineae bacterium]